MKYSFNPETRYNSTIENPKVKALFDNNKLSKNDAIDFEIFLANCNLSGKEKDTLLEFVSKVACS